MKHIAILIFGILLSSPSYAAGILVNWASNTETDLAGYVVYCGIDSNVDSLPQVAVISDPATVQWSDSTFFDTKPEGTYYCALKAFDTSQNYSAFSQLSNGISTDVTAPSAPTGLSIEII